MRYISSDSTDYLLGGNLVMKFAFNYYNKDHLGDNREVVNASGVVQQVTNYYPFGATYADAAGVKNADLQQYKYNGKEFDKMYGLNTYDYGARQHDPILARWDRIDPLCEKFYNVSPYAYCGNNPVNAIDPNGEVELPDNVLWALNYNFDNVTIDAIQSQLANIPDDVDLAKYCIGFEISGTAYVSGGIRSEGTATLGKVMFLGGEDAGYIYTYISGSAGVGAEDQGAVGLSASVNVFFGEQVQGGVADHSAFNGPSKYFNASAGVEEVLGVNLEYTQSSGLVKNTHQAQWQTKSLGVSAGISTPTIPIDVSVTGGVGGTRILDPEVGKSKSFGQKAMSWIYSTNLMLGQSIFYSNNN